MENMQENMQNFGENMQEGVQNVGENMAEGVQNAGEKASEGMETAKEKLSEDIKYSGDKMSDAVLKAKEKMPNVTPNPPGLKAQASPKDLKARLEWGEPALTIIDVRDRNAFNESHILGALPMPMDEVVDRVRDSLEVNRDIYIYGDSDQTTAQAASQLRQAGFQSVAEIKGGLPAWKAIAGPTDGSVDAVVPPIKEAYNLPGQLKHHEQTQSR